MHIQNLQPAIDYTGRQWTSGQLVPDPHELISRACDSS